MKTILGIETSCDETSVAIVRDHPLYEKRILNNVVVSQIKEHMDYGGVVPELAARAHLFYLKECINKALQESTLSLRAIDAIAVTAGPGLIGGVLVGVTVAKALASTLEIPFIGVNHLEGHALSPRLSNNVDYPYLLLLASGGHCQFIKVKGLSDYELIGATMDDAAGEVFDKTAKLLNLGYPGGPALEKWAQTGNEDAFKLPRPLFGKKNCDLSFSGLKTAIRLEIEKYKDRLTDAIKSDLCASFQKAVADHLCDKALFALNSLDSNYKTFVVAGGVAANRYISKRLQECASSHSLNFVAPPIHLCTDNAAMIAWAGLERFNQGFQSDLNLVPRPRWPLSELYLDID